MVDVVVKKTCVGDGHSLTVLPWAQSPDLLILCFSTAQLVQRVAPSRQIAMALIALQSIFPITWHSANVCLLFLFSPYAL